MQKIHRTRINYHLIIIILFPELLINKSLITLIIFFFYSLIYCPHLQVIMQISDMIICYQELKCLVNHLNLKFKIKFCFFNQYRRICKIIKSVTNIFYIDSENKEWFPNYLVFWNWSGRKMPPNGCTI